VHIIAAKPSLVWAKSLRDEFKISAPHILGEREGALCGLSGAVRIVSGARTIT